MDTPATNPNPFKAHEVAFVELREKLIRTLGTQTVDLIIERASVEIAQTYPAMALIRPAKGGDIDFSEMEAALGAESESQIRAQFAALQGVILLVLARLLGKEIVLRLTEGGGKKILGGETIGAG